MHWRHLGWIWNDAYETTVQNFSFYLMLCTPPRYGILTAASLPVVHLGEFSLFNSLYSRWNPYLVGSWVDGAFADCPAQSKIFLCFPSMKSYVELIVFWILLLEEARSSIFQVWAIFFSGTFMTWDQVEKTDGFGNLKLFDKFCQGHSYYHLTNWKQNKSSILFLICHYYTCFTQVPLVK